ncbi:MAG: hypothetical protein ACRD9Q_08400 [Nitrososphaeraceae archaeon]
MGNYWKRRFFQERQKMRRHRRQMKIALGITIAFALIFGTLFVIGYTGKQAERTATETANSFYIQLVNWVNAVQDTITSIFGVIIVILIILFYIWMIIPRKETTGIAGAY